MRRKIQLAQNNSASPRQQLNQTSNNNNNNQPHHHTRNKHEHHNRRRKPLFAFTSSVTIILSTVVVLIGTIQFAWYYGSIGFIGDDATADEAHQLAHLYKQALLIGSHDDEHEHSKSNAITAAGDVLLHRGRVFQEFLPRILDRHTLLLEQQQYQVVIVSSSRRNSNENNDNGTADARMATACMDEASRMVADAASEFGHATVHQALSNFTKKNATLSSSADSSSSSEVLLLFLSTSSTSSGDCNIDTKQQGREEGIEEQKLSTTSDDAAAATVDELFDSPAVQQLLQFADSNPLNYMDASIKQKQRIRINGPQFIVMEVEVVVYAASNVNISNYYYGGHRAIESLISAHYRVQLLAATHFLGIDWPPNTLITLDNIEHFFCDARQSLKSDQMIYKDNGGNSTVFRAYLFATRGLELAIPSRRTYLDLSRLYSDDKTEGTGRTGADLHPTDDIYLQCPTMIHQRLKISFDEQAPDKEHTKVFLDGYTVKSPTQNGMEVWLSSTDNQAEAACVRWKNKTTAVACTARIIPIEHPTLEKDVASVTSDVPLEDFLKAETPSIGTTLRRKHKPQPNILSIFIPSLDRSLFKRSLQRTANLARELNYTQFHPKDNTPLVAIKHRQTQLIKELSNAGYATFQAANTCYTADDLNMTKATHGGALQDMMCFDFDRPNCVGGYLASELLAQHAEQFVAAYSNSIPSRPYAAFLTFVDAQEETSIVIRSLDDILYNLMQKMERADTIILLSSDGGISYGPYYRTFAGKQDLRKPLLLMSTSLHKLRLPSVNDSVVDLEPNPLSVYNFISEVALGIRTSSSIAQRSGETQSRRPAGTNSQLLMNKSQESSLPGVCTRLPLPPSILSFYSDIPKHRRPQWPQCSSLTTNLNNGMLQILFRYVRGRVRTCTCATNDDDWHLCKSYVRGNDNVANYVSDVVMESCGKSDTDITIDIRIQRNETLVRRFRDRRRKLVEFALGNRSATNITTRIDDPGEALNYMHLSRENLEHTLKREASTTAALERSSADMVPVQSLETTQAERMSARSTLPSILFIEVDSVSKAHAERHFPRTNELLQKYALRLKGESYECGDDESFCAATFSEASIVGVNSIPNQIAELSGCTFRSLGSAYLVHECFDGLFSVDDECLKNGQFFNEKIQACRSCPPEYILRDPLKLCTIKKNSMSSDHLCCVNDVRKNKRVCRDSQEQVGGLQLLKRVQGDFIWCPVNPNVDTTTKKNIHATSTWAFDVARDLGYITFFGEEFCYSTSPYVVQNIYFPIDAQADYFVHTIFCRLAAWWKKARGMPINKELWAVENDSASRPQPCVDGRSKQQFSLQYLQQIWRAYPDVPKFAYLNALAAHDYSVENLYLPLGAEAYDELLSSSLRSMMTSGLLNDTMVILRSDHGLQGGPSGNIEYSTQQEHLNVWNNIILPARFRDGSASFEALAQNQDRMVSGFDLYHTMIRHMARGVAIDTPVPSWSYDLLNSVIPRNRTCADARIEAAFCPCMEERDVKFMRPRFVHGVKIGDNWAY